MKCILQIFVSRLEIMQQTSITDELYRVAGMFLLACDSKIDAASFFLNFLRASFWNEQTVGKPNLIDINVAHHYFSVQAEGCYLPASVEDITNNLSRIFDLSKNFKNPSGIRIDPLGFLQSIVWFSEYCLVDISIQDKIVHQAFIDGEAVGHQTERPKRDNTPIMGFAFTLPDRLFKEPTLPIERLKQAINLSEKDHLPRLESLSGTQVILHQTWCKQSHYHYSVRITPERIRQ